MSPLIVDTIFHDIIALSTSNKAALVLSFLQLYTNNHIHASATTVAKYASRLLRAHAIPVVMYSIGHTTPNTHAGGLPGTFIPLFTKGSQ